MTESFGAGFRSVHGSHRTPHSEEQFSDSWANILHRCPPLSLKSGKRKKGLRAIAVVLHLCLSVTVYGNYHYFQN